MRGRQIAGLAGVVLLVALLCSCLPSTVAPANNSNPPPVNHNSSVKVVVTQDFGKVVLLDRTVEIEENTTALDALQQVAEVQAKYGGGFINAINGISSEYEGANGNKKDWFVYVNGLSSNIGAADYILRDGDIEYLVFRDWGFRQFIPAIIGNFPEPFLHGYGGVIYPTVIAYQNGWEEDAKRIADRLSHLGITDVSTSSISKLRADEKQSSNLILLGTTTDCQLIEELNQNWSKLGFYAHFQDESLQVFNWESELATEYGAGVGVIQATQSPWNPKGLGICQNVVWMVSGLDETGVKSAVDALVNHDNNFWYTCAVVLADGQIIRVP